MALWLCRLSADEQPDSSLARDLGLGGWVVAGDLLDEDFSGGVSQSLGLPLVLEWHLTAPLAAVDELRAARRWAQWLQSVEPCRWHGRPLVLVHGSDWLCHPRQAGSRLKAAFEFAAAESIWLLQRSGESAHQFDGACEAVNLPPSGRVSSERANYEVHLRDAHWREPPKMWTIPAVRGLPPKDQYCYSYSSSGRYCEWLQLLSRWSEFHCEGAEDAPVLIESWEGHRLWWNKAPEQQSPDPLIDDRPSRGRFWGTPSADHVAVFVHGYYLDSLGQMLATLPRDCLDLYVSTPLHQLPAAVELLRKQNWPCVQLFGVPNRGRDMAPFLLELLPAAQDIDYEVFIKVHTKSSPHLGDGVEWGNHLVTSLLNPELIQQLLKCPPEGLLAPAGTVVPITLSLQNNGVHLAQLQQRFGVSGHDFLSSKFVAGSMFAGCFEALKPLLQLALKRSDFEPENGQVDGTLAHALERWIGVVSTSIDEIPGDVQAIPGFGFSRSRHPNSLHEVNDRSSPI